MTAMAAFYHANTNCWRSSAALMACLALLTAPCLARSSDRQKPMHYVASYTRAFNAPNTVSILKGKVKITQGTLKLSGDLARLYLDANTQVARILVTGHPARIQQLDNKQQNMCGEAATLDYDTVHEIAVLSGHARVRQQGHGEFQGDKLSYHNLTGMITGQAGPHHLIHGVFLPQAHPSTKHVANAAASNDGLRDNRRLTKPK